MPACYKQCDYRINYDRIHSPENCDVLDCMNRKDKEEPDADMVKVVRCWRCAKRNELGYCKTLKMYMDDRGFCCFGMKK